MHLNKARRKAGVEIDFSTWSFAFDKIDGIVAAAATQAVKETLEHSPPTFWLPSLYGKGAIDRIEIELNLPLGKDEDEDPAWIVSLAGIVFSELEMFKAPYGGIPPESAEAERVKELAAALRRLADAIELEIYPCPPAVA